MTQIEVRGASLAVGYHDGSIRLFDTETGDSEVSSRLSSDTVHTDLSGIK